MRTVNFNLSFMDDKHHPLKATGVTRDSSKLETIFTLDNGEKVSVRDYDVERSEIIETSDSHGSFYYVVITKE